MARIDAPVLDNLTIIFIHHLISAAPQLTHFVSRTPKFKALDEARVVFDNRNVWVRLPRTDGGELTFGISCNLTDRRLFLYLQRVCSSFFPQGLISAVERLYIFENGFLPLLWQDGIDSSRWLLLLGPFTAVKDLYTSRKFAPRIAPALQELVGERVTEVLPTLETLFVEVPFPSGPVQEFIGEFIAARQLAGYTVAVSCWERKRLE